MERFVHLLYQDDYFKKDKHNKKFIYLLNCLSSKNFGEVENFDYVEDVCVTTVTHLARYTKNEVFGIVADKTI